MLLGPPKPRYSLRTLLILLAIGPPVLGYGYVQWQRHVERQRLVQAIARSKADYERFRLILTVTPRIRIQPEEEPLSAIEIPE